jgi:8-oxo-dGTP diphosphatase
VFDVVVVYLLRQTSGVDEVLLGKKGRGLGKGRIVGPGGKVSPGESERAAAVREVFEEVGLTVSPGDLTHGATLTYPFINRPENSQRSFVFTATVWEGTPRETEELAPSWYRLDAMPWENMWDDAKLWLPRVFQGQFVEATVTIGDNDDVVDTQWASG